MSAAAIVPGVGASVRIGLRARAEEKSAHAPSPEGRIGEFLLRLSKLYAVPTPHGNVIQVYLTHEQIAAITGTSRVTVTRTLTRLRKAGAIAVEDGRIRVIDGAALRSE